MMRKTCKKAFASLLVLCMLVTALGSVAFADSYESIAKDSFYRFYSSTYDDESKITITANSSNPQLGVTINDNFKTKKGYTFTENGTSYAPTMYGINTNDITFGVKTIDGYNFLFLDAPKNYSDSYGRIFSKALPTIPGINYVTDAENATDSFTIDVDVAVKDNVNSWALKFMQHNDEKNYYMFVTSGSHTLSLSNKVLIWGLYKVKNGVVTALKEVQSGDTDAPASLGTTYNQRLVLTYDKGEISVLMGYGTNNSYYSGTVVDADPYTKNDVLGSASNGKIEPIQLMAFKGGSQTGVSVNVAFKDILIYENVPYINSDEPADVMYADVAEAAEAEVIDLGKAYTIRRMKYSGELTAGDVLVSTDGITYKKLTDISSFTDGEWLNNITAQKYRYVKSTAAADLEILTEFDSISKAYNSDAFNVYAKIGGADATVTGGNEKVAAISGNTVTTVGLGKTTFTATDGTKTLTGELNVTSGNAVYASDELDVAADTANLTGSGVAVTGTSWRTKTAAEGQMGKDNTAPVKLTSNMMRIYGSSNASGYDYTLRYNQSSNNEYYPALVYEGASVGANQIVDLTFKKSDAYSYPAIKILAHNNGDGYILAFSGNNDGDKTWYLYKESDGVVTLLANGEKTTEAVSAGKFPLKNGESKLRICYANGSIGFTLNYNNEFTIKGSYYDASPFNLNGAATDVWLMAGCKYGNISTDNLQRYVDFYDISFNKYTDNGFEFDRALYEDKAEGKTATENVIDLGAEHTLYYVKASNVTADTDVYVSQDGIRYYYLTSFAADGYYQNTEIGEAFRYVKLVGGTADLEVFTKVEALSKAKDASIAVDGTNLTFTSEGLAFTKGQNLLLATYDANNNLDTIKRYNIDFNSEGIATVAVDDYSSAHSAKAFIWNSLVLISPLTQAFNLK